MLSDKHLQEIIDAAKDQPESIVDQATRFISELSYPFNEDEEKRIDELIKLSTSNESYQKAEKIVAHILVKCLPECLKKMDIPTDAEELTNMDISFTERFVVSLAKYIKRSVIQKQ